MIVLIDQKVWFKNYQLTLKFQQNADKLNIFKYKVEIVHC